MDEYFQSYDDLDSHKIMLDDKSRVLAYRNAIFKSKKQFEGKVVMDVGAGTGILSVFCVQAGARKVYSVEASGIVKILKEVLIENNVQDKVKVIHSKVEDILQDSLEKVDIIVSEWMGFYMLHEGMLDSVLFARDNFLRENGLLFPCTAKLYVSPCQIQSMYTFWDNVHGVRMSCVGKEYRISKSMNPSILHLGRNDILAKPKMFAYLDLYHISIEEISLFGEEEYMFICKKDGRYQGICIWFEIEFPDGSKLSTGPYNELTHWKQTVLVLPEDTEVSAHQPIAFKLTLKRDESNSRRYTIEMLCLDAEKLEHDIPCKCYMTKCIVANTVLEYQTKMEENSIKSEVKKTSL